MSLKSVVLLVIGLCAGSAVAVPVARAQAPAVQDSAVGAGVVGPGDVITLKVWREPEWSGDFAVNEDGVATFPRLGPVAVTGMSADSLRRFLVDSLGQYLVNPSIEVVPQRRIRVLGAVRNPGLYPVPATVTIGDAVALAGGAIGDGQPDKVVLRRGAQKLQINLTQDTRLTETPIRSGDELFVPQRGWVSRNDGLVAAALSAATSIAVALMLR